MTKRRAPLTFENALTKVASHIGWALTAEIVGQAERTVRNWSDPDTTAAISLQSALDLDVAFHKAGGEGEPFLRCYAHQLDAERIAASPELAALIASAASSARESGEAVAATLAAARASSTLADMTIAEREIEEALDTLTNALAQLRARRKTVEEGNHSERHTNARALGVAHPMRTA